MVTLKFIVKERIFSLGDSFDITNPQGEPLYRVKSKVLSLGDKLRIDDLKGNECYNIEQRVFRFLPEYNIYTPKGQLAASVKKKFSFIRAQLDIESLYGNYTVKGDLFSREFNIFQGEKTVASVSKKWVALSDTYGIQVDDEENEAFIIALAIVIDQLLYDKY